MTPKHELKTITLTVRDDYTGLTSKITRQCSSHDDLEEVIAILREMLLALGYQPGSIDQFIHQPCLLN